MESSKRPSGRGPSGLSVCVALQVKRENTWDLDLDVVQQLINADIWALDYKLVTLMVTVSCGERRGFFAIAKMRRFKPRTGLS
ncbi:MAG: hypothetical protein J07HQX50_02348 [Haloquadratum sp. J07HQX50]|nr:MAG: hypothetical protein J07HQX50_02348 [Haloquadratum sp. J07HQX50]